VKRVLGIVVLGVGVAVAVFAACLRFYVTPIATNIPYDLDESISVAEAPNGKYINTTNGQIETGTLRSSTWVVPQPVLTKDLTGDLAGDVVIWDVYSQLEDVSSGKVITADSEEIALDRKSGAAADWDGAWIDSGDGQQDNPYEGHSYKLPFNAEKKSYPYWDGTLGRTVDIEFQSVEQVSGMEAYKYAYTVTNEQIDYDPESVRLLRTFFGGGSGDVYYSVTRTIWVEPVTGQFLNVTQSLNVEFKGGNGTTKLLLAGDFEYTQATKASSASSIENNRSLLLLVSMYLPIGGGAGGLVLIIGGVLLIVLTGRKDPSGEAEPKAEVPTAGATA